MIQFLVVGVPVRHLPSVHRAGVAFIPVSGSDVSGLRGHLLRVIRRWWWWWTALRMALKADHFVAVDPPRLFLLFLRRRRRLASLSAPILTSIGGPCDALLAALPR